MRSKVKKRKSKFKVIVLLISCIFLISFLSTIKGSSNITVLASEETLGKDSIIPDTNKGEVLTILKSAEKDPNIEGRYKISLKAQGKPIVTEVKKADIVMVVDTSSSMMNNINKIKESMKNFCDKIRKTNGDIKICLVQFNDKAESSDYLGINDKDGNEKFAFHNIIDNIKIYYNKGTNTQAGIMKAGDMLAKAREESQKYVVFFTDGLPTFSNNYKYEDITYYDGKFPFIHTRREVDYDNFIMDKNNKIKVIGNGKDYYDVHFKGAQIEYNKIIGGIKDVGGISHSSLNHEWWNYDSEVIKFPNTVDNKKASFYSIGIITSDLRYEREIGEKFLKTLNNCGYQYSSTFDDANKFYDNIAADIYVKINSSIATNVVLKDRINGEFFKLAPEDQRDIRGIDTKNVEITESNDNELITFNVGDMTENLNISFNIDVKDEYLSGSNIPTNIEATASYISPITNANTTQTYNIPKVTIEPKVGMIKVVKEISTQTDKGLIANNSHDNDKFQVEFIGNNKSYNLSVSPSEGEKTLEFYMKKNDTLINHKYINTSRDIGFVDIGEYRVNEILKMRYLDKQIFYKYSEGEEYKNLTDPIKIDKDHPIIYIKIVNIRKDSKEWTDDDEKNNELKYPTAIQ